MSIKICSNGAYLDTETRRFVPRFTIKSRSNSGDIFYIKEDLHINVRATYKTWWHRLMHKPTGFYFEEVNGNKQAVQPVYTENNKLYGFAIV